MKGKLLLNSEGTEQRQGWKLFEKSHSSGQECLRLLSGERWLTVRVQEFCRVLLGQQWQSWKTPYHSKIRRGKPKQTGWPKSSVFPLHPQVLKQTSYKTSDSPRRLRHQCLTNLRGAFWISASMRISGGALGQAILCWSQCYYMPRSMCYVSTGTEGLFLRGVERCQYTLKCSVSIVESESFLVLV